MSDSLQGSPIKTKHKLERLGFLSAFLHEVKQAKQLEDLYILLGLQVAHHTKGLADLAVPPHLLTRSLCLGDEAVIAGLVAFIIDHGLLDLPSVSASINGLEVSTCKIEDVPRFLQHSFLVYRKVAEGRLL